MNTAVTTDPLPKETTARGAYEEWRKIVDAELKGVPFEKKLVTKTAEGIVLQPVYTRLDAPKDAAYTGRDYRTDPWIIAQEIGSDDVVEFNKRLLSDLGNGLNSVTLEFSFGARANPAMRQRWDWETALKGVELSCIPVFVRTDVSASATGAFLVDEVLRRGTNPETLTGCVAADPLAGYARRGASPVGLENLYDDLASWTTWCRKHAPKLSTILVDGTVWEDAGANAAQELGFALAAASEYLSEISQRGLAVSEVASKLRFRLSIGSQFFKEVAKFRALRPLWTRLLKAYGIDQAQAPVVDGRTSKANLTLLDPHVNMLRLTTEAFSAVLGGVNALTIAPYNEAAGISDDFSRRISRNMHTLLSEEFRLQSPSDPARGSWYVEKLTDELARAAWTVFQEVEKRGGLRKALEAGFVQESLAKSAKDAREGYETRRLALLGTNLYPNPKDKVPVLKTEERSSDTAPLAMLSGEWLAALEGLPSVNARFDAILDKTVERLSTGDVFSLLHRNSVPAPTIKAVSPLRWAEGFEKLRARVQRYSETQGRRPKVYLTRMGPALQHKARADFSAGFFAVASFELLGKETHTDPATAAAAAAASGADAVVLCSTDETYPDLVPVFAGEMKRLKPEVTVVLAGYPTEHIARFQEAGIDAFIHMRANVRATLEQILTKAGIGE